jgi:hypothetical protein
LVAGASFAPDASGFVPDAAGLAAATGAGALPVAMLEIRTLTFLLKGLAPAFAPLAASS